MPERRKFPGPWHVERTVGDEEAFVVADTIAKLPEGRGGNCEEDIL